MNKGNLELLSEIKANRSVIHAMNDNQRVQNNVLPSPQQIAARPPVNSNAATPVAYETIIGNGAPKGAQPRPSIIMKPYQNQIREMVGQNKDVHQLKNFIRSHTLPLYPNRNVPSRTHHLTQCPYHPIQLNPRLLPTWTSRESTATTFRPKVIQEVINHIFFNFNTVHDFHSSLMKFY